MDLQAIPLTYIITVVTVLLSLFYYWIKNKDILPGPTGVPYLGLYPFLTDENAHLKLEECKKKYGDIFSFTFTGRLYVNLGSVKTIREVHINKSECFTDRFGDSHIMAEMLGKGVTFVNGEPWKVLRKFFIQKFRMYGLNTVHDNIAGPVYDTLNATVEELKNAEGSVSVMDLLNRRCTVTMRKMIFGEEGVSDQELGEMILTYTKMLEGISGVKNLITGPVARFMLCTNTVLSQSMKYHKILFDLTLQCCKKIEKDMNYDNPTCIIEEFYKEKEERRRNNDPTSEYFSDRALVESVLQFVGDGTVAVAALVASVLHALLEHPQEQEKLYSEIMDVVGPGRDPSAEDRVNLPYTNAFINECVRVTNFVIFFPSLECTRKRSCFGEPLVMLQCFLFLTHIVQNFKITSSSTPSKNTIDILLSGQVELIFSARKDN